MSQQRLPGTEIAVERDVPAPMRDGTVLKADVYRPNTEEPLPVLIARSPYGKTANLSTFGNSHPAWFAQQGYVVVMQDSRGRFESEGEFTRSSTRWMTATTPWSGLHSWPGRTATSGCSDSPMWAQPNCWPPSHAHLR